MVKRPIAQEMACSYPADDLTKYAFVRGMSSQTGFSGVNEPRVFCEDCLNR